MLMPKVEYTAMLLGATGNVGGHILHLLVQSPLCKKVVVVTRRNVAELANAKVQQVVVNMDTLEEELAPHAKGVDIALAAFGVGKGSAKMADAEVFGTSGSGSPARRFSTRRARNFANGLISSPTLAVSSAVRYALRRTRKIGRRN